MPSPTTFRRRLNELELRSRLRARPRLQGRILAPAGLRRRLPRTPGLWFPFYHDVPAEYAGGLRRHLRAFGRLGRMAGGDEALTLLASSEPLTGPIFVLSFDDAHASWRDVVAPILLEMNVPATFFVTSSLIGKPGNLGWRDIRDLDAAGFTIGSHTVTHPRLADLGDEDARREILGSKWEIENELGTEVRDFAAPYGNPLVDFTARDVDYAREAGYRSFVTTRRDPMQPGGSPWSVSRQGLHPAWPLPAVRTRVHD
jgi:peptidoglycan/xylan/chitin deacetylase (PgdA/CDA1 family)